MKITEAENIVAAELGSDYTTGKLGRYWLIFRRGTDGKLIGTGIQSPSLPRAIALAKVAS